MAPARIGEAEGRRGREPRVSFAFALVAMTHGTFLRVDNGALGVRAAAGWQPDAVRPDADVPGGGIGGRDRLPEMKGNSSMAFLTGMLRCMVGAAAPSARNHSVAGSIPASSNSVESLTPVHSAQDMRPWSAWTLAWIGSLE